MADVGVDIGMAKIALADPDLGWARSLNLGRSKLTRHEQLHEMKLWLLSQTSGVEQLWIDRPLFHGTGTAAGERLTETVGMILSARDWLCAPVIVHSSTWKAQVLGDHTAGKSEIQAWLENAHPRLAGMCHDVEDEYDAMVIGLYGLGRSTGRILAPEPKKPKRRVKKA